MREGRDRAKVREVVLRSVCVRAEVRRRDIIKSSRRLKFLQEELGGFKIKYNHAVQGEHKAIEDAMPSSAEW